MAKCSIRPRISAIPRPRLSAGTLCGSFQAPSTTAEVLAVWEPKWGETHRRIMRYLVERGGEAVTKNELAEAAGMTPGGSFSARLSEVRSSGLLTEPGRGLVAANKEALFLDGAAQARQA